MADVDVMAFGAHPDDIEIGCGGTLIKLADMGYSIVLVDMSWGELGTRGSVETRMAEAANAAKIIGAIAREESGLGGRQHPHYQGGQAKSCRDRAQVPPAPRFPSIS